MNCKNCNGGYLLQYSGGSWVSIEEGDERSHKVYCSGCGQIYRVEQKIMQVEEEGNIQEELQ